MKILYTFSIIIVLSLLSCKSSKNLKTEVVTLAETTKSWNGDKLPDYLDGEPKITILRITIPPHTKLKIHKHLVINAGVLTKGELLVVDEDNNRLTLKAGDPIIELVNKYHHGENNTNKPAEIIVFYAGNVDVPITVLKDEKDSKNNH